MGQDNKKAAPGANRAASDTALDKHHPTPPTVTGQCGQVLGLIREHQPVLSFTLTADHAIPETAARVHDLRCMGFNVLTTIHPAVEFRGVIRRNVASYSLGSPEWPQPGFPISRAALAPVEAISAGKLPAFLEAGANLTKGSADAIAGGLASIPEHEKPTARRAIIRNLRNFLEFSRWRNSSASGQAGA
jgi:hypothetical protein